MEGQDERWGAPRTAREALFAILWLLAVQGAPGGLAARVRLLAEDGLDFRAPENFELSDQLADRLAEAHKLLREVRDLFGDRDEADNPLTERNPMLNVEIDTALALPPDLEAMVERRIGARG